MPSPGSGDVAVVLQRRGDSKAHAEEQDKESAAYLRRREQVRRAQRTHRERKENYIKALEDELFQVKARERKFAEENKALNAELAQLRDTVTLDQPTWCSSSWDGFSDVIPYTASEYSISQADGSGYASPLTNNSWQLQQINDHSMSLVNSVSPSLPITSPLPTRHSQTPISSRHASPLTDSVNQTDLAIEFVMTYVYHPPETPNSTEYSPSLEKPCLNRATSAILNIGQPHTDHALKPGVGASSPAYINSTSDFDVADATSYHAYLESGFVSNMAQKLDPGSSLEKLLSLSSAFDLTDELTPVQAWAQIVAHPAFGTLGIRRLGRLVEDTLEFVRCYGFGAVIKKTAFEALCKNLFAGKSYVDHRGMCFLTGAATA